MRVTRYDGATEFLRIVQPFLEEDEVANGLKLGICLRLQRDPEAYGASAPYLATVEENDGLALAAIMTPPHNLLLYSPRPQRSARPLRSLASAFNALAVDLIAGQWPVPGVMAHVDLTEGFARAYAAQTGKRYHLGMSHRIYRLTEAKPPRGVPGHLRQARLDEAPLVAQWLEAFSAETRAAMSMPPGKWAEERIAAGVVYVWEVDGRPVSLAANNRNTARGATIGGVYTPPEFRRRGYASACVAALSQRLLDAGFQFCTLLADLANPTSNHVYQEIGYRPVCDTNELIFE